MTRFTRTSTEHALSSYSINTLRDALHIRAKEVISLVGAGGKTTLMFALASELKNGKGVVITTTTTKIFPPSSIDAPHVLTSGDRGEIIDFILENGADLGHINLASGRSKATGKLLGVEPAVIKELIDLEPVRFIIVEADGAARKPLKAPNPAYEPVIPPSTSLVIPVIGIEALGQALTEKHVFRSEIAVQLTGLSMGEAISAEAIANLIVHPSGIIRGKPARARVVPFINKVDLHADLSRARELAVKVLEAHHPQIDRVVLGQAQLKPPVREVIFKE